MGSVVARKRCHRQAAQKPFSIREKVAEGRMRGQQRPWIQLFPLTLTLSLMERGEFEL
jgi:hypothetical protein